MAEQTSLNILLVDDEEVVHRTIGDYLTECGHRVESVFDGVAGQEALEAREYDLALVDIRMPAMDGLSLLVRAQEIAPDLAVVIITGHGDMETAIQALRLGAADFLAKPIKLLELDAVLEKSLRFQRLHHDGRHLRETIRGLQTADELREGQRRFVGRSGATHQVRRQIRQAVEAECDTILITGETGTGKEVVAREIHFEGSSEDSPFIAVSCPALPQSLVESELFGHVKGAFTGASADRAGYFELAQGGTLFLDEVGDLSAEAQAKMLRAMETRSLRRVGGTREIRVEIRVVAATNANLGQLVADGRFRSDLLYRLNVYAIELLPLRERAADILPLAEHFASIYAARRGLQMEGFSPAAGELLMGYGFPGNARELRNLVERAAILCGAGQIQVEHLSLPGTTAGAEPAADPSGEEEGERAVILAALDETKWNRRQAARNLGMPYSTLRYKIDRLGIA